MNMRVMSTLILLVNVRNICLVSYNVIRYATHILQWIYLSVQWLNFKSDSPFIRRLYFLDPIPWLFLKWCKTNENNKCMHPGTYFLERKGVHLPWFKGLPISLWLLCSIQLPYGRQNLFWPQCNQLSWSWEMLTRISSMIIGLLWRSHGDVSHVVFHFQMRSGW